MMRPVNYRSFPAGPLFAAVLLARLLTPAAFGAGQTVTLAFAENPGRVAVDDRHIYLLDGHAVTILDRKDFSVLKRFGRRGEGPGEFTAHPNDPPGFALGKQGLVISAQNRVLVFSRAGECLNQVNSGVRGIACQPLGKLLVGIERPRMDKRLAVSYQLYDNRIEQRARLYHYEDDFQSGEGLQILKNPYEYHYSFAADDEHAYIYRKDNQTVGVFDSRGELLRAIALGGDGGEVSRETAERIIKFWKEDSVKKQYFPFLKPVTVAPRFPALRQLRLSNGILYVITYKRRGGLNQCRMFRTSGESLGECMIPLREKDPMEFYPLAIHDGMLFQLMENDEDEWVLKVHEIR